MVGKIYARVLVDRVRRGNGGLIDDKQEGFREGKEYINFIVTLKQIGEKA